MKTFSVKLNEIYGEMPRYACSVCAYLPDNSPEIDPLLRRPAILIMPGGGYEMVSDREGEPVALEFAAKGYAAFVLRYSVVSDSDARFPVQLLQAAFAMKYIRDNAAEMKIDSDSVFAAGFSAGGHLCGCLGLLYNSDEVKTIMPDSQKARPDALLLGYPVVSSGKIGHAHSFANLFGDGGDFDRASLEKMVTPDAPPAFIWHTADDDCVAAANSLLLATAYAGCGIPFELHVFESGAHGLSLADERTAARGRTYLQNPRVAVWTTLALAFLDAHRASGKNR